MIRMPFLYVSSKFSFMKKDHHRSRTQGVWFSAFDRNDTKVFSSLYIFCFIKTPSFYSVKKKSQQSVWLGPSAETRTW